MAALELAGETHAIAPFRLRELRRAAPFIDRLAGRLDAPASVAAAMEAAADMLGALAVGIEGVDAEALLARATPADLPAIGAAFRAVLAQVGMTPAAPAGEPPAGEGGGAPAP